MDTANQQIRNWAEEIMGHSQAEWSRLPEIELYMDQVITYMEKQLKVFRRSEDAKSLTPSMINNYVKDKLLNSPERKKYSRDHLATLYMICMLKPVLSIPDVSDLLGRLSKDFSTEDLYQNFSNLQTGAFSQVADRISAVDSDDGHLLRLALELSIESTARHMAVEKILTAFLLPDPGAQSEEKKNDKPPKTDKSAK